MGGIIRNRPDPFPLSSSPEEETYVDFGLIWGGFGSDFGWLWELCLMIWGAIYDDLGSYF